MGVFMSKIVSTMPYEQITMVKIFWDGEDFCIDFVLGDITHLYVVKKDKWETIAFGGEPISHHMETDWYYAAFGAETFSEKFEIDELLAVSELHRVYNWRDDDLNVRYDYLNRHFSTRKEEDFWIDPAGGVHCHNEEDPAKMYE
jgi:hypothetical protein